MNELNSKLKIRKELADSILKSSDSKDSFFEAEFSNLPEANKINFYISEFCFCKKKLINFPMNITDSTRCTCTWSPRSNQNVFGNFNGKRR